MPALEPHPASVCEDHSQHQVSGSAALQTGRIIVAGDGSLLDAINARENFFSLKSWINNGLFCLFRCTVGTTDSPHAFLHNCSSPVVRVDKSTISGPTASDLPVHSTLVIHHYATKSQEEFEIKMLRGSGMRRQRGWEYFYFVDGWSSEFNFDGLRAWDDDLTTMSRMLDPEVVREQLARYAGEVHEDFWGAQSAQQQRERAQLEQDQWGAEHASQGIAGQDEEDEDAHVVASMNDYGDRVDDTGASLDDNL